MWFQFGNVHSKRVQGAVVYVWENTLQSGKELFSFWRLEWIKQEMLHQTQFVAVLKFDTGPSPVSHLQITYNWNLKVFHIAIKHSSLLTFSEYPLCPVLSVLYLSHFGLSIKYRWTLEIKYATCDSLPSSTTDNNSPLSLSIIIFHAARFTSFTFMPT